jgi:hypothetical protein
MCSVPTDSLPAAGSTPVLCDDLYSGEERERCALFPLTVLQLLAVPQLSHFYGLEGRSIIIFIFKFECLLSNHFILTKFFYIKSYLAVKTVISCCSG